MVSSVRQFQFGEANPVFPSPRKIPVTIPQAYADNAESNDTYSRIQLSAF